MAEYHTGPRPDLFSATSPHEGVKLVIPEAASSNKKGDGTHGGRCEKSTLQCEGEA